MPGQVRLPRLRWQRAGPGEARAQVEERKAREVIAGCEDMLAEMALIEAAERNGVQTAEVHCTKADRHSGKRAKRR